MVQTVVASGHGAALASLATTTAVNGVLLRLSRS